MIKVVEAFELKFFDLEHIEDPFFGEDLLKEYLRKNPYYKGGYTTEYYLERYRSGRIFVVVSRPRKPMLRYDYANKRWIVLTSYMSPSLDFNIRSIIQSVKPPARIEPKSPKTKEEAEKEAQALQDKGFTSMVSIKDPSGDGYIVCNRETAGEIASKGSTAEMTYISGVNGPKAEAVVNTVDIALIGLGGIGVLKAGIKHKSEIVDGTKALYKSVKKSIKRNANKQIDKLNNHPDLKPKLRDDGTTEYIDKKNQKVIAEVDKDGVLSYKYDGFGGDIVTDPNKTTTFLGKFHDPIDEGKGCKYFLGDKETGIDGLPDGTFSRGKGTDNKGGLNSLDVPEYDDIIAREMTQRGVTDPKKLDGDSWDKINKEFWDDYNEPFLEDAFKRGDNIRLISDPVKSKSGTYKSELDIINGTGKYKDQEGLASKYGYTYDESTATYIKE